MIAVTRRKKRSASDGRGRPDERIIADRSSSRTASTKRTMAASSASGLSRRGATVALRRWRREGGGCDDGRDDASVGMSQHLAHEVNAGSLKNSADRRL